jgi:hypothetical protein
MRARAHTHTHTHKQASKPDGDLEVGGMVLELGREREEERRERRGEDDHTFPMIKRESKRECEIVRERDIVREKEREQRRRLEVTLSRG